MAPIVCVNTRAMLHHVTLMTANFGQVHQVYSAGKDNMCVDGNILWAGEVDASVRRRTRDEGVCPPEHYLGLIYDKRTSRTLGTWFFESSRRRLQQQEKCHPLQHAFALHFAASDLTPTSVRLRSNSTMGRLGIKRGGILQ